MASGPGMLGVVFMLHSLDSTGPRRRSGLRRKSVEYSGLRFVL